MIWLLKVVTGERGRVVTAARFHEARKHDKASIAHKIHRRLGVDGTFATFYHGYPDRETRCFYYSWCATCDIFPLGETDFGDVYVVQVDDPSALLYFGFYAPPCSFRTFPNDAVEVSFDFYPTAVNIVGIGPDEFGFLTFEAWRDGDNAATTSRAIFAHDALGYSSCTFSYNIGNQANEVDTLAFGDVNSYAWNCGLPTIFETLSVDCDGDRAVASLDAPDFCDGAAYHIMAWGSKGDHPLSLAVIPGASCDAQDACGVEVPTPTSMPPPPERSSKKNKSGDDGALIAAVAVSLAGAGVCILVFVLCWCKKKQRYLKDVEHRKVPPNGHAAVDLATPQVELYNPTHHHDSI